MNSSKYLIVGMGPGETSQARALAKYIVGKKEKVIFAARRKVNLDFVKNDKKLKVYLSDTPRELKKIVDKEKPDVLLLFNSKIWKGKFSESPPFKKPRLCVSVDSNWLFNDKKYYPAFRLVQWLDMYLVNLPQKIFKLGLKENGGNFDIPKDIMKSVIPVGFIPSYKKPAEKILKAVRKKYGVKKNEKFIFSYFSGFGAGHRVFAFNNMIKAVDRLVREGKKIKVLYVGPTEDIDAGKLKRTYLISRKDLGSGEFFRSLASSDLVFQHQGMVTLAQAISARIPVICNVHLLPHYIPQLHFWEVGPFDRLGACKMFSKSASGKEIAKTIKDLLYNKQSIKKMLNAQKDIFECGEPKSYKLIKESLKKTKRYA